MFFFKSKFQTLNKNAPMNIQKMEKEKKGLKTFVPVQFMYLYSYIENQNQNNIRGNRTGTKKHTNKSKKSPKSPT